MAAGNLAMAAGYTEVLPDSPGVSEYDDDVSESKSPFRRVATVVSLCACCVFLCILLALICIIPLMNTLVGTAINLQATRMLGTQTSVDSVSLGVFSGKSVVIDTNVANPAPMAGRFLHVEEVVVAADVRSLFLPSLHFQDLELCELNILINDMPDGQTNAQHIMNHLKTFVKEHKTAVGEKIREYASHKKVTVDRIMLTNISFVLDLPVLNGGKGPMPFKINNIVITEVGAKDNGVYLFELLIIVLQALLRSLVQTVPLQLRDILGNRLVGALEDVLDYGPLHANVGHGLVTIGKGIETATDVITSAGLKAGTAVANTIDRAADKTENALTTPFDQATNNLRQTDNVVKQEKAFHKMVAKPFDIFHKWAKKVKNVTVGATTAVSNAGDGVSDKVEGAGQTVATGFTSQGA